MRDTAPPEIELGPLGGSLGFLLRLAQLKNFGEFYEALGPQGLRPGEFSVLALIGRNPGIRQGVLAQRLWIKRAHMTKLVRGFAERQLVDRQVPADDRRALELKLTDAGRALVAEHAAAFHAHGAASGLAADEHAELVRLLRRYLGLEGAER